MRRDLRIHSANLGGGKDVALRSADGGIARADEFAAWVRRRSADVDASVALVQEITTAGPPDVNLPDRVATSLSDLHALVVFTPTVSTARYPLAEKWGEAWRATGFRAFEEGLATFCIGAASIAPPEASTDQSDRPPIVVLDLPIFEFAPPGVAEDEWLSGDFPPSWGMEPQRVTFRSSYYQGSRDTDPRVATAHRVRWEGEPGEEPLECVVVNLHLGTLWEENRNAGGDDGTNERSVRVPTPASTFLRWRQLDVVRQYVEHVYRDLRLAVVVAGDFNAEPASPELGWFCNELGLVPLFGRESCWRCGAKQERTQADCPACGAPLFSHAFHLQLLDNVLCTAPGAAVRRGLTTSVSPWEGADARIIDREADFSDHLPLSARVTVEHR